MTGLGLTPSERETANMSYPPPDIPRGMTEPNKDLLLSPEERGTILKQYFDYRTTLIDKPIGDSLMVTTEKQVIAKLIRLGWKSPEEVQQRVNDARLICKEQVLEALFEELDRIIHVPLPSTRLSNNFGVIIRESYQALKRKYLVD